jgi:ankyrin repeat protein
MTRPSNKVLHSRAIEYSLMAACHHADVAVVRWSLTNGANIRSYNNGAGYTPLHAVCEIDSLYPQWEPMKGRREREEIVKLLLSAGADPNTICQGMGVPPVYCAVRRQYYGIARLLIDAGADVNLRDASAEKESILWAPLIRGSLDIVKLLLDAGVDVDGVNGGDDAMTVALYALKGDGREEVIRMLIMAYPHRDWTESLVKANERIPQIRQNTANGGASNRQ